MTKTKLTEHEALEIIDKYKVENLERLVKEQQEVLTLQDGLLKEQKKVIMELLSLNRRTLREWKWSNTLWLITSLMIIVMVIIQTLR
jgi:hypothetical protein